MLVINTTFEPDVWVVRGRRGDSIPAVPVVFPFTRADITTMTAGDWTALGQLRATADSATVLHEFTITLADSGDTLNMTITPMTGAESAAITPGTYLGDIQLTKSGEQPLTIVTIQFTVDADYARTP